MITAQVTDSLADKNIPFFVNIPRIPGDMKTIKLSKLNINGMWEQR